MSEILLAHIDVEAKPVTAFTLDVYGYASKEITRIMLGDADVTPTFLEAATDYVRENV